MDEQYLRIHRALLNFLNDACAVCKDRPLHLYRRLVYKTRASQLRKMGQHITAVKAFCSANKDAILTKDASRLVEPNDCIRFSDTIFVNARSLLTSAPDITSSDMLWNHLIAVGASVEDGDDTSFRDCMRALRAERQRTGDPASATSAIEGDTAEDDLLASIVRKVERSVEPGTQIDPNQAVQQMMSSGMFGDVMSSMTAGLSHGTISLPRLMSSVNSMITKLGVADEPQIVNLVNVLGSLPDVDNKK